LALNVFNNDLILRSSSEIVLDLAGTNHYDRITVAGEIDFNGKLTVRLAGGFTPEEGDTFDLFDWNNESGAFSASSSPSLPSLSGGKSWDISNLYVDGSIKVVPEPFAVSLIFIFGGGMIALHRSPFFYKASI